MKTDFLKGLGLDQDAIDAIMAENGKDINAAKADLDSQKARVKELEKTISNMDEEMNKLKTKAEQADNLQKQFDTLKSEKEESDTAHKTEIDGLKKTYRIETGLRDAKARSVKAVLPFIDVDKVTMSESGIEGLEEQIKALKEADSTSFLFDSGEPPSPKGLKSPQPDSPNDKPTNVSMSFSEAVAAAISKQKGDN